MDKVLDLADKELTTQIKIKDLAGNVVIIDPKKWLSISPAELEHDIQNQNIQTFTLQRAKDLAILDLENAQADLKKYSSWLYVNFFNSKQLRAKNNGRKPTVALVNAAINLDATYLKKVKAVNHKEYIAQILKDLSYDLQNKSNLLQTESNNIRSQNQIRNNNV